MISSDLQQFCRHFQQSQALPADTEAFVDEPCISSSIEVLDVAQLPFAKRLSRLRPGHPHDVIRVNLQPVRQRKAVVNRNKTIPAATFTSLHQQVAIVPVQVQYSDIKNADTVDWSRTRAFFTTSSLSLFCGILANICLWSMSYTEPVSFAVDSSPYTRISSGSGSGTSATESSLCQGDTFNLVLNSNPPGEPASNQDFCFASRTLNLKGERFSLNLFSSSMTSGISWPVDEGVITTAGTDGWYYSAIYLFTSFSVAAFVLSANSLIFGCSRSARLAMFLGSALYSSLTYAMVYGAHPVNGVSQYCRDLPNTGDINDADCDQWKAGYVFMFFQGVALWIAGVLATPVYRPFEEDMAELHEAPPPQDEAHSAFNAAEVTQI